MTQRITVVPAAGRFVPDPEAGDLLPAEGRAVPDNVWWRRRLVDGDVTVQESTKASKSPKTEEGQ
jgi:hypothetical protein